MCEIGLAAHGLRASLLLICSTGSRALKANVMSRLQLYTEWLLKPNKASAIGRWLQWEMMSAHRRACERAEDDLTFWKLSGEKKKKCHVDSFTCCIA